MISNPTPQRGLRGHRAARPSTRQANTAEYQAVLAWRLTPRDKWIARMLWEHRVLTTHQISDLAFPSARSARMRLRELYSWGVLDRFQPFVTDGTAPMHYVLAPAGATILAAEDGIDVKTMGYHRDRVIGIAHSLRLAHTVGVNEWFTALVDRAHHPQHSQHQRGEHAALTAWWSETRCTRHFGDLIRPDGYGRWHHTTDHSPTSSADGSGREIEWFLEFDFGTEVLAKLAGKLAGYAALAESTGITTPVLIWTPTIRREATARRALTRAWRALDSPRSVPVATAAAELLDPHAAHPSPADPVWLPLDTPREQRADPPRHTLIGLLDAWPHIPALTRDETAGGDTNPQLPGGVQTSAPPPSPMPPTTSVRARATHRPRPGERVVAGPDSRGGG